MSTVTKAGVAAFLATALLSGCGGEPASQDEKATQLAKQLAEQLEAQSEEAVSTPALPKLPGSPTKPLEEVADDLRAAGYCDKRTKPSTTITGLGVYCQFDDPDGDGSPYVKIHVYTDSTRQTEAEEYLMSLGAFGVSGDLWTVTVIEGTSLETLDPSVVVPDMAEKLGGHVYGAE